MGVFGFKTSLFGFNKQDVNNYLISARQEFNSKTEELEKNIAELEKQCEVYKTATTELTDKLNFLNGQLERFKGKEEEIEKMSIGIGTMYLTAKQNANEIISEAQRLGEVAIKQSQLQLNAVNSADQNLDGIKQNVKEKAESFAAELDVLKTQIGELRAQLEQSTAALTGASTNAPKQIAAEIEAIESTPTATYEE